MPQIVDEAVLNDFRGPGFCEYCHKWCQCRQPHHLWARGRSSAWRLDIRINLISLGATFECNCHDEVHLGGILRDDLLAVVAQREGQLQDNIRLEILRLRRAPKP